MHSISTTVEGTRCPISWGGGAMPAETHGVWHMPGALGPLVPLTPVLSPSPRSPGSTWHALSALTEAALQSWFFF